MRFYSVEQAFQSLKFPLGSIAQVEILNTLPKPTESDSPVQYEDISPWSA